MSNSSEITSSAQMEASHHTVLVPMSNHKLDGTNYSNWSKLVELYLTGKGKFGYLTGSKTRPASTAPNFITWVEENAMVMSWFLNSMTPDISPGFMRLPTAKAIWDAAAQTYSVGGNSSQIYDLKRRIHETIHENSQKNSPLSIYFTALQVLWQELDYLQPCEMECAVDTAKLNKRVDQERVFEFLAGLNSSLDPIRVQVLGKDPIPTLREAYACVRTEELRRTAMLLPISQESSALISSGSRSAAPTMYQTSPVVHTSSNRKGDDKDSLYCDFCHKHRHTRETCFKLHGNPSWYSGKGGTSGSGKGGRSAGGSGGGSRAHLTESGDSTQTSHLVSDAPPSVNSTQSPPPQMEQMFREFARRWNSKEASSGSSSLAKSGPSHGSDDWTW